MKENKELPNALSYYSKSSYSIQQKARFVFYLCIAAIIGVLLLILSSIYVQLNSPEYNKLNLPVILSEIILLLVLGFCIFLLRKGKFNISTHLFMITAMLCVWFVLWVHKGNAITQIDTIILIVALINLTPLFITKYKITILFYLLANLLMLFGFVFFIKDQLNLSNPTVVDIIMDTSIAIIFSGLVGYNIFKINKQSLEKAESDNLRLKKADEELRLSELFRQRVFDSSKIPIIVMESSSYKFIDINQAAVDLYGFSSKKESLGKTPEDVSAPAQYDGTPSSQKAANYIEKAIKEGSVVFEWLHQRPNGEFWDAEVHLLSFESNNETLLQFSLIDITEKKKVAMELKESEEQYKTLIETSKDGISLMDLNGNMIYVNRRKVEMLGANRNTDLIGKNIFDLLKDGNILSIKSKLPKIIKEGYIDNIQATGLRVDGSEFPTEINFSVVRHSDGSPRYLMDTMRDISKRIRALETLKESQQLFKTLAQVSPVGIFRTRADGYTTYVNPKWMELSGLSLEEAIGDGWLKAVHPADKERIQNNWKDDSIQGEESYAEYRFIKPDGQLVWVLGNAVPEIVDNKITGYIGTITDITDQKKAEKILKESEEKYRTLMESMNEVIMMVDNQDRIQYVNKKFIEKTGYLAEDVIGEIGFKFLFDQNDMDRINNATQNRGENFVSQYELSFAAKDGSKISFLVGAAPLTDSEGISKGFILAMADITEKKKIEKELEKHRNHLEVLVKERTEELAASNEELVSINEELHLQREELEVVLLNLQNTQKQLVQAEKMASLGVLASGVAHEINNPLNFIKGGAFGIEQYIEENLKEHKEELLPLIEGINIGIDRAANIVTSLNHYNRRSDSNFSQCDIHTIIDNCLSILRNQIAKRIVIDKNYSKNNYLLLGNEGKLHQAMLNILSNAVQAIDGEGSIVIKTIISEKNITISVSDTGCGISDQIMPKIFDPFFTTKEPGKGTGLGLSITFNIIEEHKGTIDFKSKEGEGTTAKIVLPLKKE